MLVRRVNNRMPDLGNVIDNFFGGDFFNSPYFGQNNVPAVNVSENEDCYEIEVAAPGFTKDDFKVELNNSMLTISSEKEDKKEEKEKGYLRREFSFASFNRSFSIPRNQVDESKIDASYKDGVLKVVLHKREEVKPKPARMISIK